MKKIMPILLMVACCFLVQGQEGTSRFGIQVSPSVNWMRSTDNLINSNGLKLGFSIGGMGEYYLSDWMIVQGGFGFGFGRGGTLLYKRGGNLLPQSDLTDPSLNEGQKPLPDDTDITYSLSMLEVPFGLQYIVPLAQEDLDLFIAFPILNLGVISKSRGRIQATGIDLEKQDIGNDVKSFNLSWSVGAGVRNLTAGNHILSAGLYYESGLADLTSNKGTLVQSGTTGAPSITKEESKGTLNGLIFKFAILF